MTTWMKRLLLMPLLYLGPSIADKDDTALALGDECASSGSSDCALSALQMRGTKQRREVDQVARSDRPTNFSITSAYARPANHGDIMPDKFTPNEFCKHPPCSGQLHIQLGGPGEMVVSFASSSASDTKPIVRYGKAEAEEGIYVAAEGTTQTYSQLMHWNRMLWKPVVKGGHGLTRAEVAEVQSTSSWAFDEKTGDRFPAWRERNVLDIKAGMGWYKNPSENYDSPAIHTVTLNGLEPGAEYDYQVDNDDRVFRFKMPRQGPTYPFLVGLTSDVGQTPVSNSSMHLMLDLKPEVVLLPGDLSYADGYYPRWDSFGIMFESLGARVPVMTCPGNHEQGEAEAYKSYNIRYPMPHADSGSTDPNYWSRDIGPMHVISLNTYAGSQPDGFMYRWLERDLRNFDRGRAPWLVVMMHAPFYNSNQGHLGEAKLVMTHLEDLLYEYGANLVLAGHVHSYERTWPTYKNKTDACGPVYLNLGDAGNREGPYANWLPGEHGLPAPDWSAFREGAFGIGKLDIRNGTHAQFTWKRNACFDEGQIDFHPENCSSSGDNSVSALTPTDTVWIVRPSSNKCQNQAHQ